MLTLNQRTQIGLVFFITLSFAYRGWALPMFTYLEILVHYLLVHRDPLLYLSGAWGSWCGINGPDWPDKRLEPRYRVELYIKNPPEWSKGC